MTSLLFNLMLAHGPYITVLTNLLMKLMRTEYVNTQPCCPLGRLLSAVLLNPLRAPAPTSCRADGKMPPPIPCDLIWCAA